MKHLKKHIMFGLVLLLLLGIDSGFAQQTESGSNQLLQRISSQLSHDGWSDVEINRFLSAASSLDWSSAVAANAQVVALALEFAVNRNDLTQPQVLAQLAQQIAVSSVQLERAGVDDQSTALMALNTVRNLLPLVGRVKSDTGDATALGNAVRSSVEASIVDQIRSGAMRGGGRPSGIGNGHPPANAGVTNPGLGPPPFSNAKKQVRGPTNLTDEGKQKGKNEGLNKGDE